MCSSGSMELKECDKFYDYAFYNDLGDLGYDSDDDWPVLRGSSEYLYPDILTGEEEEEHQLN